MVGLLARSLSVDVWKDTTCKPFALPGSPSSRELRLGIMRHAKVVKVRKLSRRYLLAELELIEPLEEAPGLIQFVLIWLPGVDYMPMSIADYDGSKVSVFFSIRGEGTRALANSAGRVVGLVGPLGKALTVNTGSNYVLVAGGTGLAPLIMLAKKLSKLGLLTAVAWGTRRGEDVGTVPTYFKEVTGTELIVYTEDCSLGFCGKAVDFISKALPSLNGNEVVAAGPNDMLATIADLCFKAGVDPVLVLESTVKCGLGICGSCVLGETGLRLCREGPAFRASKVIDYLISYHDPAFKHR